MSPKRQIALLAGLSFLVYAVCRQKTVGHCDPWAYFAQAQLFLGRDPGLHGFDAPLRHPALTPLGLDVAREHYVSAFPVGYSLLLAAAGKLGAEFFVSPALGALSVVLVYAAAALDSYASIAFVVAALWAVCPLVGMYSTDVMSDMLATVMVLGSYLCLRSARFALGGAVLGLSLMVRPMDVLFLPAALLLLPARGRSLAGFAAALAAGAAVTLVASWVVWGAPMSPSYHDELAAFVPRLFALQFPAYLWQTWLHLGPVLVFAALAVVRSPRWALPLATWVAAFFLVYSIVGPCTIDWPRARFLLPAYPPIYVLGARGALECLWFLRRRGRRALQIGTLGLGVVAASSGFLGLRRALRLGALMLHPPRDPDLVLLSRALPRNALVGALEFSGSLRLYAGRETFVWAEDDALGFARSEYERGRPVYLLLEPDAMLGPEDRVLAHRFPAAFVLSDERPVGPQGYVLQRIDGVRSPGFVSLPLALPSSQWALLDGWLGPEALWAPDYRGVACRRARMMLPLRKNALHELRLVAAAGDDGAPVDMHVSMEEGDLGHAVLGPEFRTITFVLGRARASGPGLLSLRFPGGSPCDSSSGRALARVRAADLRVLAD